MKATLIGLAALCVQVCLSVPHHRKHKDLHAKRYIITDTSTVTDIITVTSPDVIIWVDEHGNVISTESRNLTPMTTSSDALTTSSPPSAVASTTAPPTTQSSQDPDAYIIVDGKGNTVGTSFRGQSFTPLSSSASETTTSPPNSTPQLTTSSSKVILSSSSIAAVAGAPVASNGLNGTNKGTDKDSAPSGSASGFNICYDLIDSSGKCKSADTLESDFAFLSQHGYSMVRFYDIGCDIGAASAKAGVHGMKVFAGLNGIGNLAGDLITLTGMINGNWGNIHTINIGNEVVNNGLADAITVIAALTVARPILRVAGFTGNIVTVETFTQHEAFPSLCEASDYCAANAHAFFDSQTQASGAGDLVMKVYNAIKAKANGKQVIITESGWPYAGSANGAAVPSPDNQRTAISSLMAAFSSMPGNLFFFQAYDASYKKPGSLGIEQFFGIYDGDHYNNSL